MHNLDRTEINPKVMMGKPVVKGKVLLVAKIDQRGQVYR